MEKPIDRVGIASIHHKRDLTQRDPGINAPLGKVKGTTKARRDTKKSISSWVDPLRLFLRVLRVLRGSYVVYA